MNMNTTKAEPSPVHSVAERLQVAPEALVWDTYEPRYQELLTQELTLENVEQWLEASDRLGAELNQTYTKLSIWADLNTKDEESQQRLQRFSAEVMPHSQRLDHALNQKWLALSGYVPPAHLEQLYQRSKSAAELFCEANVELRISYQELMQKHAVLTGNQKAIWQGKELTIPQIQQKLTSTDRAERQAAWEAWEQSHMQLAPELDELFLELLRTRRQMAKNAGFDDFRSFRWKELHRVDYTPADCLAFHEAVHTEVVPALQSLLAELQQALGLDRIRPWDYNRTSLLDAQARPAVQPFRTEEEFKDIAQKAFEQLDPQLAERFRQMREEYLLDLFSRDGKMTHAYCGYFPVDNQPFVLMNAVGNMQDVQVLFHELGHAFHGFLSGETQVLAGNRWSPIEFVEIPSMALEFLTLDHLQHVFDAEQQARYLKKQLEGVIAFLPWAAQMDAFQHWLYADAPQDVSIAQIDAKWLELDQQFHPFIDWQNEDQGLRKKRWHYYHIFQAPFYYIEYAMCYLAAVGIWKNARQDKAQALAKYKQSLSLGSTVSIPKLYEASGVEFRFDRAYIKELVAFLMSELEQAKHTATTSEAQA